jgi:hypothetical protein
MKLPDYHLVCKKHHAAMDSFGYIYVLSEQRQAQRIGKIFYKIATDYYHIESTSGKRLEGQQSFEAALLLLINHKDH